MKRVFFISIGLLFAYLTFGQYGQIGQTFEESKAANSYDTLTVKVGADFGIQYQNLYQHADSALAPLGRGFNLPEANLNLDAYLAKGIRVNMVDYLSTRHHDAGIVKGGFIQIDRTPFIKSDVIDHIMDYVTIKVGDMELNYGDEHFRRTDNGRLVRNAFIGNYIMDAFTTAPAIEIFTKCKDSGWLGLFAVTTGSVNQTLTSFTAATKTTPAFYTPINTATQLAYYGKIGYDKQITPDFRLRLTLSGYFQEMNQEGGYLYGGDRAGTRYYLMMNRKTNTSTDVTISSNFLAGDFPTAIEYNRDNSYLISLFMRYKRLEFFGTFESATGTTPAGAYTIGLNSNGPGATGNFNFEQIAVEGIYHFGHKDQFYGGLRYDNVSEKDNNLSVDRVQVVVGWYLTPNIVSKIEYVNEAYNNFYGPNFANTKAFPTNSLNAYGADAGFNGIMIEAGISF